MTVVCVDRSFMDCARRAVGCVRLLTTRMADVRSRIVAHHFLDTNVAWRLPRVVGVVHTQQRLSSTSTLLSFANLSLTRAEPDRFATADWHVIAFAGFGTTCNGRCAHVLSAGGWVGAGGWCRFRINARKTASTLTNHFVRMCKMQDNFSIAVC